MLERRTDEKLFKMWLASQSELTFEEFKQNAKQNAKIKQEQKISSNKKTSEIMVDVKNILNSMRR